MATLIVGLLQAAPVGAQAKPMCRGVAATIVGTPLDDVLNGTDGDDVIVALGGNDIINGNGGNDLICGNPGSDIIDGGPGRDKIFGGYGNDVLFGGSGHDRLHGQQGDDQLAGSSGPDGLWGGAGKDTLMGGVGGDRIRGGSGLDLCLNDRADRSWSSCEGTETLQYRTIELTATGNGDDPTGTKFGDPYFAGAEISVYEHNYGLPVANRTMNGKKPIRVRVPTTGTLDITKVFPGDYLAIGGTEINSKTPRKVTVEMFCCATY